MIRFSFSLAFFKKFFHFFRLFHNSRSWN